MVIIGSSKATKFCTWPLTDTFRRTVSLRELLMVILSVDVSPWKSSLNIEAVFTSTPLINRDDLSRSLMSSRELDERPELPPPLPPPQPELMMVVSPPELQSTEQRADVSL